MNKPKKSHAIAIGMQSFTPAETAFKNWFKRIDNHISPAGMTRAYAAKLLFLAGYHTALDNQAELDKITREMIGG